MPHQRSPAELQEHGKILYKRKEYTKALELFTEAINSSSNLTVSLLDNRAATYDKLEDITSALKDAKSTIRISEKNPTGYLRAGKLLQKAGKHDIALGIYKRGMKMKVTNVEILVKLHDKLLRSTAPSTAADPFAQLPIELVEMILAHLSFRQIVYCTGVSKQWNTFIASLPNLWTTLDLSEAKKPVKINFITHCINRSHRKITTANLKLLNGSDKVITALTRHCKNMQSLSIVDGGIRSLDFVNQLSHARNLTKLRLGIEAPMGLDCVSQLLCKATTLTHVEIYGIVVKSRAAWALELPTLSTLALASCTDDVDVSNLNISSLLQRTPNLQELTIAKFVNLGNTQTLDLRLYCSKLQRLDLSRCYLRGVVIGLPPTLRALRLDKTTYTPRMFNALYPTSLFLPSLEELEVSDSRVANVLLSNLAIIDSLDTATRNIWLQDPAVMAILRQPPSELSKLKSLEMELRAFGASDALLMLLSSPRLSGLEHLRLTDSHVINDDTAELIALNFPDLKALDLSSTAVTGYGVKKIVEACLRLKTLKMKACEHCSGDAIEWARRKGIKVEFAITAVESKGKKVRYGS